MDKLEFYKKQYAFIMGEIGQAIDELEDHHVRQARQTLVRAMAAAEERWIDAYTEEYKRDHRAVPEFRDQRKAAQ